MSALSVCVVGESALGGELSPAAVAGASCDVVELGAPVLEYLVVFWAAEQRRVVKLATAAAGVVLVAAVEVVGLGEVLGSGWNRCHARRPRPTSRVGT